MDKIKTALGSSKWWLVSGLAMAAGWGLSFALLRLFAGANAGVLVALLVGAPAAFLGRFSSLLIED